jgi:uncharacterized protein
MDPKILITALWFISFFSINGWAASFSCEQTTNALERTICADSNLSLTDEKMAKYYNKLKETLEANQSNSLLKEQRAWLKQRLKKCSSDDAQCLQNLYGERINQLRNRYEKLVPFNIGGPGTLQGLRSSCDFHELELPKDLNIYSAGAYGGRSLDIHIDDSGHQATQFDVIVNSPEKPVVLLLGAYEPSIWNIGWTKGTDILAVAASGYHRQAVAGLPKDTPLLISTHVNKGPCDGYLYVSESSLAQVNPMSQKIFGKPVDMVYFANAGKVVLGKPITSLDQLITSQDVTPDSFIDKNKPLAGSAGIQEALAKGLLRPSTREDAEAWANQKSKLLPKDTLPPVSGGDNRHILLGPFGHNVYVIQKKFTIPAGLYGGHSATFYLPKGVPYPEGNFGHSVLYDFNTMTCSDAICNIR